MGTEGPKQFPPPYIHGLLYSPHLQVALRRRNTVFFSLQPQTNYHEGLCRQRGLLRCQDHAAGSSEVGLPGGDHDSPGPRAVIYMI